MKIVWRNRQTGDRYSADNVNDEFVHRMTNHNFGQPVNGMGWFTRVCPETGDVYDVRVTRDVDWSYAGKIVVVALTALVVFVVYEVMRRGR